MKGDRIRNPCYVLFKDRVPWHRWLLLTFSFTVHCVAVLTWCHFHFIVLSLLHCASHFCPHERTRMLHWSVFCLCKNILQYFPCICIICVRTITIIYQQKEKDPTTGQTGVQDCVANSVAQVAKSDYSSNQQVSYCIYRHVQIQTQIQLPIQNTTHYDIQICANIPWNMDRDCCTSGKC